ncbi:hypothetical protein PPYR_05533 [Photinus pyralis]|uniref:ZAD domain-containing protein n=1 Tax=Photinus pyralis TaxID=7054 RepID=A0A5N4AV30_PHOPY|nr:hypothetical protein PPYR_05533 [Photinus pyralis]
MIREGSFIQTINESGEGVKICRVCGKSSVPLSVVTPDDDCYVNAEECMLYELTSAGKSFSICETCEASLTQCAKGIINHLTRSNPLKTKNCRCCFTCGTIRDLTDSKLGNTKAHFAILERIRQRFGYKNENDKVICMPCRVGLLNLYRIHSAVSKTTEKLSVSTTNTEHETGSNAKNEGIADIHSLETSIKKEVKCTPVINNSTVTTCEKKVLGNKCSNSWVDAKLEHLTPALILNKEKFNSTGKEAFKISDKGGKTFKAAEAENQEKERVTKCAENDCEHDKSDGVKICRVCGKSSVPLSVVTPDDDCFFNAEECMLYEITSTGKSFSICETCESFIIQCTNGIINHLTRSNVRKTKNCRCCFLCGTIRDIIEWKLGNTETDFAVLERIRQRFGYKNENDKVICMPCRVGFLNLYRIHSAVRKTGKKHSYCTNALHDPQASDVHSATHERDEIGSNLKNDRISDIHSANDTKTRKHVKCTLIDNSTVTPEEETVVDEEQFDFIGNKAFKIPGEAEKSQHKRNLTECGENDSERDKNQVQFPVQEKVIPSPVTPRKGCLKTVNANSAYANLSKVGESPKSVTWDESYNRIYFYHPEPSTSMPPKGLEEVDSLEDSYTDYDAEESDSSYELSSSEEEFYYSIAGKDNRNARVLSNEYKSKSKGTPQTHGRRAVLNQPVITPSKCCTETCHLSNTNEANFVTWLRNVTEVWKDIKNCSCSHNQAGVRCIQELNAAGVSEDSDNVTLKYRTHGQKKYFHRSKKHISLCRKQSQTDLVHLKDQSCNTDTNICSDVDHYQMTGDIDNEKYVKIPLVKSTPNLCSDTYYYIKPNARESYKESVQLTQPDPVHSAPKTKHVADTDKLLHPTELNIPQTSTNQHPKIKEPLLTTIFSRSGKVTHRDRQNGDIKNQLPSEILLEPELKNEGFLVKKISPQSTQLEDPLISKSSTTDARCKSRTQQGKSMASGDNETQCDVLIENSNRHTMNVYEDLAPILDSTDQRVEARTIPADDFKKKIQERHVKGDIDIHQKLESLKCKLAYPKNEGSTIQGSCEMAQDTSREMEMANVKEGDVDTISSDSNDPKHKAQKLFEAIIKSGIPENVEEEETSCEIYLKELLAESLSEKAPNNKHSDSKLVTEDTKAEPICEVKDDSPTYASDTSCDVSLEHEAMPNKMEEDNQDDLNAKAQSIISLLNKIRSSSDVVVGESGVGAPDGSQNTNIENTIQTLYSLVCQMQASNNSNEEEECRSQTEDYSQVDDDCTASQCSDMDYSDDLVFPHQTGFPKGPNRQ